MDSKEIAELEKRIRTAFGDGQDFVNVRVVWHENRYLVSCNGSYIYEPEKITEAFEFLSAFFLKASVMNLDGVTNRKRIPKRKRKARK